MHRLYVILFASIGTMALVAAALWRDVPPSAQAGTPVQAAAGTGEPAGWHDSSALLIKRDSSGQFHLDAQVNGESVRFLVDTGADLVALTEDDAQSLGLAYGEMQPIMQTASGTGPGAMVTIEELEVAGKVVRDVEAVVVQDLAVNLLGQSVLRELGGVELKGDEMVIRKN
jgi:aspartyl protease family protein